jgi:hydrophobic/amphiphilic exporter-1 (mainly G- bacteria), HAE1 family
MTITELSIKRPTLVVVFFSFLAVLGIFGYSQLKFELLPKMTPPIITVTTIYPGGSPNEVETSITKYVEDAVSGLDKVSDIRATSYEGRSMVVIEFEQNVNVDLALQDATRKVNEILDKFPTTARKPIISKIAFDEIPVIRMSVKSNLKSREFYQFITDRVQPRLSKLEGVGQVAMLGGEEREVKVNLDLQKIYAFGLSIAQVTNSIKASNLDFPTGNMKDDDNQYVVRLAGKFANTEDMKEILVGKSKAGGEIRLKDVADIQDGAKDMTNINRLNGIPSIGILVQKSSDANSVSVSKKVRQEIAAMEKDYGYVGMKFEIAQDASEFTTESANAVEKDLLIAIVLVAIVMLVFLHSIRNSLIVMVAIPTSLVSVFFLMYIFDFTLNLMTLLAMSLVIGILVDDSIVVLENIYRHLEKGEKPKDAAIKGRNEIGFAALSITFVDVVVFVPMALITGIIGNLVRQYSLVVVFSTLMSLVVSFTVTPMLASKFTKLEHLTRGTLMGRFGLWFESKFNKIIKYYASVVRWSLNNGWKVIAIAAVLFLSSFMLLKYGFVGTEFMPNTDRGEFSVVLEYDPGTSIENTNLLTQKVEKIIADIPEVKRIITGVGASSEGIIGVYANNTSEINVQLSDKNQREKSTDEIGMEIKKQVTQIPGVKVRVNPIGLFGTSNQSPVQVVITGPAFADVYKGASIMLDVVKHIPGTTDVRLSAEEGKPELRINIDRKKMSLLGLTINDIGQNLRVALTGDNDSRFREGINEYDIRILMDKDDRTKTGELGEYTFMNNKGQLIKLKQFADFELTTGPTKLERQGRITSINLFSQIYGRASGDVAAEIRQRMESVKLPDGVNFAFTGQQKFMKESFINLFVALFAGILFVYMILVALYNSYFYPFVVLFSIPVATIGAFIALALTMKSISIFSIFGLIMLVGLVAKNGILLVDRTNQMREEKGMRTFDAIIEAGETRLRPILMTTFAMVMGMLPIAIASSAGSEMKSALGVVLIGGLLSSMFLTLVLVPVVYLKLDNWKTKSSAFLRRLFKMKEAAVDNEITEKSEEIL